MGSGSSSKKEAPPQEQPGPPPSKIAASQERQRQSENTATVPEGSIRSNQDGGGGAARPHPSSEDLKTPNRSTDEDGRPKPTGDRGKGGDQSQEKQHGSASDKSSSGGGKGSQADAKDTKKSANGSKQTDESGKDRNTKKEEQHASVSNTSSSVGGKGSQTDAKATNKSDTKKAEALEKTNFRATERRMKAEFDKVKQQLEDEKIALADELKKTKETLQRQSQKLKNDKNIADKLKKENDRLKVKEGELEELKVEEERLKEQLDRARKEVSGKQDELAKKVKAEQEAASTVESLKKRVTELHSELESTQFTQGTELSKLTSELTKAKTQREEAKRELDLSKAAVSEAKKTINDKEQTYNRLLEARIRQDPNNENLNEKWRKTKVIEAFKTLRDTLRLDFLDELEEKGHKNDREKRLPILKIPTIIFMTCYDAADKEVRYLKEALQQQLRSPLKLDTSFKGFDQLETEMRLLLKGYVDALDVEALTKKVLQSLVKPLNDGSHVQPFLKKEKTGQEFLKECVVLAWAMAIQHPPISPVNDDEKFEASRHNLFSECRGDGPIDFFVWPTLVGESAKDVLEKGVVFTK